MFDMVEYHRNLRVERRAYVLEYLGGSCADCGSTERLHSHHIDPATKKNNIADILICSIETLNSELEKCELLCFDCHNSRHTVSDYHGTLTGYRHRKCRCDLCRSTWSEYNKKFRKSKMDGEQSG